MKFLLGSIGLLLSITIYSQTVGDCYPAGSSAYMDINNASFKINHAGRFFWNGVRATYEIPKGTGQSSAYLSSLWVSAIDQNDTMYASIQKYEQSGNDFYSGPMDTLNITASLNGCVEGDHVYLLYRQEVEEFKLRYNEPDYTIPYNILNYPGNGNADFNEAHMLAPFVDLNQNGLYEPTEGDYPKFIEGCGDGLKGDVCAFLIYNDVGNEHSESESLHPMGIEVHALVYAFYSDKEFINNTTFYEYTIINRSANIYSNLHVSQYIDSDLGNYGDDYVGCDIQRGIGYSYNGDDYDDSFGNTIGYGEHPPALGWNFVDAPMANSDGKDNNFNGVVDEAGEKYQMSAFRYPQGDFSWYGRPESGAKEYYYYMQGLFKNGEGGCYGGNGEPFGCAFPEVDSYPFAYTGTSDVVHTDSLGNSLPEWTEELYGNQPSDRSMMVSMGGFELGPYDTLKYTGALIWAQDENGDHLDSRAKLLVHSDSIQAFVDNCYQLDCRSLPEEFEVRLDGRTISPYYWNEVNTISWDFGDGNSTSDSYPVHTYENAGTYVVCMSAINDCDTILVCQELEIEQDLYCIPAITRLEGRGHGGNYVKLNHSMHAQVADSVQTSSLVYQEGYGPIKIEVMDDANVEQGHYVLEILGYESADGWKLTRVEDGAEYLSTTSWSDATTEEIALFGIKVTIEQTAELGEYEANSIVGFEITYNNNEPWLDWVADSENFNDEDWIKSGNYAIASIDADIGDSEELYESILGGTWAPYCLVSRKDNGPAWNQFQSNNKIDSLNSVDIVLTSDQLLWTRCNVLELASDINSLPAGSQNEKMHLKRLPSVDKDGNPDNSGTYGMSWFPGYAIDVSTGKRLNIIFGEDGSLPNGHDLIWNPTSEKYDAQENTVFGGKHFIYIFNRYTKDGLDVYDQGEKVNELLSGGGSLDPNNADKRRVMSALGWVGIPLLKEGHDYLESDLKIELRVAQQYEAYAVNGPATKGIYTFEIEEDFSCPILSIEEEPVVTNNELIVYPNPTTDGIYLLDHNTPVNYWIYNALGVLVTEGVYQPGQKIDMHNASNGMHFIRVQSNNSFSEASFIYVKE